VAALLTAAGNVVNDYFDVETDRINKPFRPLPSSQLSMSVAACWAATLVIVGVVLSLSLGAVMALIAAAMAVLLYIYARFLKQSFLIGNAVVSVMSAMTVVYGGMAVNHVALTLVPAVLILLFMFCREILKTVEDYEGDRLGKMRTVAVILGKTGALLMFSGLAIMVVLLSWLPWLLGYVSAVYLLIVVPAVNAVLLTASFMALRQPSRRNIRMILAATKADWILWVVAMFIGIGLAH
jgi:geranylgeranylglycerol-phosphate geranylgeranyltransferase